MNAAVDSYPARPVPASASAPHARSALAVVPAALMVYAGLVPPEVHLVVADQILYAPRIVGFLLIPWMVARLASAGFPRARLIDALVISGAIWMMVSFVLFYGAADGFDRGVALMIDALFPYLAARFSFTSLVDLRRFLVMIAPGLMVAGLSMLADSLARGPIVRTAFQDVFGAVPQYSGGVAIGDATFRTQVRLGLVRATGLFSHPIIAGAVMVTAASMYLSSGIRGWPRLVGLAGFGFGILSVSSAAVLALLISIGGFAYDRLQRVFTFLTWPVALISLGFFALVVEVGTGIGIVGLASNLSFNSATAYYRTLIWEYGSASVWNNPWIGIGFTSYERARWMVSDSIDNQWLLLAVRHGLYTALAIVSATVLAIMRVSSARAEAVLPVDRGAYFDLALILTSLLIIGATVSFFGTLLIWFYILLGAGASLGSPRRQA